MSKLMSVKEFSSAAGISAQAAYKQLKGRLLPYLKVIDGKKYIDAAALELYSTDLTGFNNQFNNQLNFENPGDIMDSGAAGQENIKPSIKPLNQVVKPENEELNLVKEMVETLQKELDRKEAALLEERQRVNDLNDKLAAAYQQIAEMGKASQYITAADKTIQLAEKQPVPEQPETPAAVNDAFDPDEASAEPGTEKKNFISRLLSWIK